MLNSASAIGPERRASLPRVSFRTPLGAGLLCGGLAACVRVGALLLFNFGLFGVTEFLCFWLSLLPLALVTRRPIDLVRAGIIAGVALVPVIIRHKVNMSCPYPYGIVIWTVGPRAICGFALGFLFGLRKRFWPLLSSLAIIGSLPAVLNCFTSIRAAVLPISFIPTEKIPWAVLTAVLLTLVGVSLPTWVVEREVCRQHAN